ncbi:MAG: hypothetical protein HN368_03520, partial [Spirochaetales bacterium]|nr:hypothetical protein [Spirochaetales bacterium]
VLVKLGVPFTYGENCRIDDPLFQKTVDRFLSSVAVVKSMNSMHIGQVGVRVDFFWTTIDNESELLQKFGIEVLPIDMADFLRSVKERAIEDREKIQDELAGYESLFSDPAILTTDGSINNMALRDELLETAEREGLDAFSVKSFSSIQTELGPGLPLGMMLAQEKIPIAAETDLHGAVTSVLLQAASTTRDPVFFPEFTIRHPDNDNAVLLWHGTAPLSLKHSSVYTLKSYPPWILKGLPGEAPKMLLKDGPLTVARFDGELGDYVLGFGEGTTVAGPETREAYVWMEVDNWPRWERAIMKGPYIHHCSAVYDHCADVLEEACQYIPGLSARCFGKKINND